ncbi:ECE2 [Symbiodinium natans]|uniref:ECE2 protein n=1 Tax=Symbiodinium natans TaxID=878477 RepID=A0A812Q029_9DINO|nr:ECE2 [Symbiodinium natans]
MEEYIFCSVRLPEATARANLSFYPIDLELHPDRARSYAAELGMPLAVRTRGAAPPEAQPSSESFDSLAAEADYAVHEGLPADIWEDLHVRFYPNIPCRLFRHMPLVHGTEKEGIASQPCSPAGEVSLPTLLPPSERLRLLLSLVADDMPGATGEMGAGVKLDKWKRPKFCNCLLRTCRNFGARRYAASTADLMNNLRQVPRAFSHYFLMQDPRDGVFLGLRFKFGRPSSPLFRSGLLSGVVDKSLPSQLQHFFGQQIGFYFAFLQHLFSYGFALTVLLAPLLAVYSVDWAQHVVHAVNAQEKLKPFSLVDDFAVQLDSEVSQVSPSGSAAPSRLQGGDGLCGISAHF